MIRVGLDIHTVGQSATGNETYTEGLLNSFAADTADDISFTYYHCNDIMRQDWPGEYRHLRPHNPLLRIPFTTPWSLRRDRIDVAHFQYFLPPISPCPAVLTIHDISFEFHPEFFSTTMARGLRALVPHMARKAAHIITVSHATRDDLLRHYKLPPEKVSVVHNGTSERFQNLPPENTLRAALARFNLRRPFIVCVGNIGPRKNQERLVRAFSQLLDRQHLDLDLVLVGKTVHRGDAVTAAIEDSPHKSRIHTTGFVTAEELMGLYSLAEFSVYTSFHEGFGLPILESMACGTPVIASTASCLPEIAGDAALLVDPHSDDMLADAIERMATDTALKQQLTVAGKLRQAEFTWAEAARKTLDVYRLVAQ